MEIRCGSHVRPTVNVVIACPVNPFRMRFRNPISVSSIPSLGASRYSSNPHRFPRRSVSILWPGRAMTVRMACSATWQKIKRGFPLRLDARGADSRFLIRSVTLMATDQSDDIIGKMWDSNLGVHSPGWSRTSVQTSRGSDDWPLHHGTAIVRGPLTVISFANCSAGRAAPSALFDGSSHRGRHNGQSRRGCF